MEDIIEVNPMCKLDSFFSNLTISNYLVDLIKVAKGTNEELQGFLTSLNSVMKGAEDVIRYEGRLCVPKNEELRSEILHEAHHLNYTIHLGITMMYQEMKRIYWCPGMKKDVVEFVEKCITCQRLKFEHQRPRGQLQPIGVPTWKWEDIICDFLVRLPRTNTGHDAI